MIDIILNWVRLNRKSIIQTFELYKDEVEKKKAPIVENEEISKIPKEPTVPTKLETENKIWIWSECSCPRTPKVKINKKTVEIFDTKDLIITSHDPYRKTYINQKNAIQEKGAKVYLCVHPWYKPWKGKSIEQCAQITKEFMGEYDGVVIDFEINFQSIDFLRAVRLLIGKTPLSIAPISRIDFMTKFYPQLADMLDLGIMWWNYSYDYASMLEHLHKYQFHKSVKQNFLLALGNKYNDILTDKRNEEIVRNLPIRCGAFNPKRSNRGWSEIKRMKDLLQVNK